ncbi:MAG: TSUP family transporter, partial [Spirochaetales bacterium]
MIIVGVTAAIVIGVVLGLLGGGGSILTVPVLVYILGVPAVQATAYSLFIVGIASVVGAVGYVRGGDVNVGVAAAFAAPSLVAVFL